MCQLMDEWHARMHWDERGRLTNSEIQHHTRVCMHGQQEADILRAKESWTASTKTSLTKSVSRTPAKSLTLTFLSHTVAALTLSLGQKPLR